jgi:hypothetical protein
MITYDFQYKRFFFWRKIKVIGHNYQPQTGKMDLWLPDGSMYSMRYWKRYNLRLGQDWVLAVKKQNEKDAGQAVPLNL